MVLRGKNVKNSYFVVEIKREETKKINKAKKFWVRI